MSFSHRELAYSVGKWPAHLYDAQLRDNESGIVGTAGRKDGEWPSFVREIWSRLYGYDVNPLDPANPAGEWARQLHETTEDMPEWKRVARHADGDTAFASLGAVMVCEALAKTIESDIPEDASGAAEMLNQIADGKVKADEATRDALEQRVMQFIAQTIELDRELDAKETEIREAIRVAATKASDEMDELDGLAGAFGFGHGTGRPEPKDRTAILKHLRADPNLRRIAKLLGRFRMIVGAKRARVKGKGCEETAGVTFGHSIPNALPQDAALYLDKRTRALAYAKALDGRLLQHERIGMVDVKTSGSGPIVIVIDESGSTKLGIDPRSPKSEYQRIDFERAVMLALMAVCAQEKRTCSVIHFGGSVNAPTTYVNGRITLDQALSHARTFVGGGTEIVDALDMARESIEGGTVDKDSDVVLLTDADSFPAVVDVPAKNMLRLGARLWSFVVASPNANYDSLAAASSGLYRVDAEGDMNGAVLRMAEVV